MVYLMFLTALTWFTLCFQQHLHGLPYVSKTALTWFTLCFHQHLHDLPYVSNSINMVYLMFLTSFTWFTLCFQQHLHGSLRNANQHVQQLTVSHL